MAFEAKRHCLYKQPKSFRVRNLSANWPPIIDKDKPLLRIKDKFLAPPSPNIGHFSEGRYYD